LIFNNIASVKDLINNSDLDYKVNDGMLILNLNTPLEKSFFKVLKINIF
jgi:hypothetical protein